MLLLARWRSRLLSFSGKNIRLFFSTRFSSVGAVLTSKKFVQRLLVKVIGLTIVRMLITLARLLFFVASSWTAPPKKASIFRRLLHHFNRERTDGEARYFSLRVMFVEGRGFLFSDTPLYIVQGKITGEASSSFTVTPPPRVRYHL